MGQRKNLKRNLFKDFELNKKNTESVSYRSSALEGITALTALNGHISAEEIPKTDKLHKQKRRNNKNSTEINKTEHRKTIKSTKPAAAFLK